VATVLNNESKSRFVIGVEEPLVSYEQVLLSQINHCAKVPHELFPLCVDNLVSLLPLELRAEVLREYEEVKGLLVKYIVEVVNECRVENGGLVCDLPPYEMLVARDRVVNKVKAEKPDLYLKHGHVLEGVVLSLLEGYKQMNSVAMYELEFSIVMDKLEKLFMGFAEV
jgi:hypothetical protein